jgi:hypothetical protein
MKGRYRNGPECVDKSLKKKMRKEGSDSGVGKPLVCSLYRTGYRLKGLPAQRGRR